MGRLHVLKLPATTSMSLKCRCKKQTSSFNASVPYDEKSLSLIPKSDERSNKSSMTGYCRRTLTSQLDIVWQDVLFTFCHKYTNEPCGLFFFKNSKAAMPWISFRCPNIFQDDSKAQSTNLVGSHETWCLGRYPPRSPIRTRVVSWYAADVLCLHGSFPYVLR